MKFLIKWLLNIYRDRDIPWCEFLKAFLMGVLFGSGLLFGIGELEALMDETPNIVEENKFNSIDTSVDLETEDEEKRAEILQMLYFVGIGFASLSMILYMWFCTD